MNPLKSLAHRLLAAVGYELRRPPTKLPADARFGINVFEMVVERILTGDDPRRRCLLQVGANNGIDEDAVRPILERFPLRSFLCEPMPDSFAKLQANYASFANVTPLNVAVGERTGSLDLFRVDPKAVTNNTELVASFDRQHVEHFRKLWNIPEGGISVQTVKCFSIPDLLVQCGVDRFDIVAVDTEGMDHLICDQVLGLASPPDVLMFEYTSSPIRRVLELMARLEQMGYLFARSGLDITAVRRSALPPPSTARSTGTTR